MGFGFQALTRDYVNLALPLAVAIFAAQVPGWIVNGIISGIQSMVDSTAGSGAADAINVVLMPVSFGVTLVCQAYVMGGVARFLLDATRGEKPAFGVVFSGMPYFGQMLVATIITSLAIGAGFLLCIVPGVILALGWFFYHLLLVDRNLTAVGALQASWAMTQGQRGNLFVLSLLLVLVALVGFALCGVGFFLFSMPVILYSMAYVYLRLQGQEPTLG